MSDDESGESKSDDDDAYLTASEHSDHEDEMHDASDRAIVEPFIYGEEPSKMDRLVFDAISQCQINCDEFPNIFRWRHTVALHPPADRERWPSALLLDDSIASPITYSINLGRTLAQTCLRSGRRSSRNSPSFDSCSTPKKGDNSIVLDSSRGNVPLQVSNWLRITGPNSPRCASASKNIGHNVSFGC